MGLVPRIGIFRVFSRGELYDIHAATLEVLEKIGVIVDEESALKKLSDAGANVDFKTRIVKIPRHLVKESVKKAPRSVLLAGRNRKYDIKLGGKEGLLWSWRRSRLPHRLGDRTIEASDEEGRW